MTVVDSIDQLREMARVHGMVGFLRRVPHYQFALLELSESGNREATERLSNYRNDCGCFAGGLVMGLTVIAFVAAHVISGRSLFDFGIRDFLVFLGLFTVSTLVGKMLGVLWARVRAIQLVRRLAVVAGVQRA